MLRLWLFPLVCLVLTPVGSASSWAQPSPEAAPRSDAVLVLDGPEVVHVGEPAPFRLSVQGGTTDDEQFAWTLGDGVEASGTRVVHRYTATGTYTLTAKAVGTVGVRPAQTSVRVLPAEPSSPSDAPLVSAPLHLDDEAGKIAVQEALGADGHSPAPVGRTQAAKNEAEMSPEASTARASDAAGGPSWTGEMWGGVAALVALTIVGIVAWTRRRRQLRLQQMPPLRPRPDPTRPIRPDDTADGAKPPAPPMPPPPVLVDVTARRLQDACAFTRSATSSGDGTTCPPSTDPRTSRRGS